MKKQWNQTSEKILDLTLEIIYLLTGQEYILIKKPCGDDEDAHGRDPCVSDGSCKTQKPGTEPPLCEDNGEKEILDLTNKIIQLLTGEVPMRCEDVAVYFSLEEWEYIERHKDLCKDDTMEAYRPLGSLGDMEREASGWFPISVSSEYRSASQSDVRNPRVDYPLVTEPQKRAFECAGYKGDYSERRTNHVNEESASCNISVHTPATERTSIRNEPLGLPGDPVEVARERFPISASSEYRSASQSDGRNPRVDYPLVTEPQKRAFECAGYKGDYSERRTAHVNEESASCNINVHTPATERTSIRNEPLRLPGDPVEAARERFPISASSEYRSTSQSDGRNPRVDYPLVTEPQKRAFECAGYKGDYSERRTAHVNEEPASCNINVHTPATERMSTHNEPLSSLGDMEKAAREWFPVSVSSECRGQNEIQNPRVDYPLANQPQKRAFECAGYKGDYSERRTAHVNEESASYNINVHTPATERMSTHNGPLGLPGDPEKAPREWFPIVSSEYRSASQSDVRNPRVDYPLVTEPQIRPFECAGYKGDYSERRTAHVNEESASCNIDVYTPATHKKPPGSFDMEKAPREWFPTSSSSECRPTSQSDTRNPRADYPLVTESQKRPFECAGDYSDCGPSHVNATSFNMNVHRPATERPSTHTQHEPVLCEIKNHLICSHREHSPSDDMFIRIVDVKSVADAGVHTHTEHAPAEDSAHQDSENRFSCFECGKGFAEARHLVEHRKSHSETKPFSCFECAERFADKPSLFRHQLGHTKERDFTCPECNRTFLYESRFSRHQKVHLTKTPMKASDCINCYTHYMRLARRKPFSCFECEERFADQSGLIRHQFIHVQQKEYPCPECGKIFPYEARLITHLRVHVRKKKYICSECGKCFTQEAALLHHQWSHTGVKPFQCTCGKVFATQASLIFHQKIHTNCRRNCELRGSPPRQPCLSPY